jgi:hypothetical protein
MVAHREKKGFADVASGRKKRDAILFLPVAVFDEGRAEAGRNQLLDLLDHAPAFVADHKVDVVIPRGSGYLARTKSTDGQALERTALGRCCPIRADASPRRPSR